MSESVYTFKVESIKASQEAESLIDEFAKSGCSIEFTNDKITNNNEVVFTVSVTDTTSDNLKERFHAALIGLDGITVLENP